MGVVDHQGPGGSARGNETAAGLSNGRRRGVTAAMLMGLAALWSAAPASGHEDRAGGRGRSNVQARADTEQAVRAANATRTTARPTIDGRLTEEAWQAASPLGGFIQREPDEGAPASEQTEVRVLYDDQALYVGARLFDRDPARIVRRLSRRDAASYSDSVSVILDPHHDHLTGAVFTVSAAGALTDSLAYTDNQTDPTWDGVWEAAVSVDAEGWTAEIRIPLSQVRFPPGARQVWGFNVSRYLQRRAESSHWNPIGAAESRLISRCGHLTGLDGLVPQRHLELLPYASARVDSLDTVSPNNPVVARTGLVPGAGLDLKWGLTSAFTLDAAINPDFGQVEADPAVVNLTAFETLFEERRPFFIEGMQLLRNYGVATGAIRARFGERPPDLVYSRRVGRAPQGRASGDFVDMPTATTILGAAKLSGRTSSGWSLSVFDAVTASESADVATNTLRQRQEVEPFTNYFAARVRRQFGRRAGLGGIATFVQRSFSNTDLRALMPEQAVVGGADGYLYLGQGQDWVLNGALTGSRVAGSPAAMERLQRAAARYFQRPDAPHVHLDTTRTSLTGWAGHVELSRSNTNILVSLTSWAISPGFESNDLGFQTGADRIGTHAFVIWQKARADRFTRSRYMGAAKFYNWNFGGQLVGDGVYIEAVANLRNNWLVFGSAILQRAVRDDRLTRGGPLAERPASRSTTIRIATDDRRRWSVGMNSTLSDTSAGAWSASLSPTLTWRPSPRIMASAGPDWVRTRSVAQYVRGIADSTAVETLGTRSVFGDLDRTDVAMVVRVNAIFTPRASLQFYAQPFVAAGRYWDLKQLDRPGTFLFDRYGSDTGTSVYDPEARAFTIDPDGTGAAPTFTVPDPAFNAKSLRINTVFRWEWRLGSTFYAVWTQQRADWSDPGALALGRDISSLGRAPADNVFMIKLAYWLGR